MTLETIVNEDSVPIVSIGMPVYNGENYLADALSSVLAQTFPSFELIICDNASTDGTVAIASAFAREDPRIRLVRNSVNLGAAPNYNRTFALARGSYFKWLAHDDRIEPEYLAKTVAALEARPELVLCNSRVAVIDEHGREIGRYASILTDADRASAVERFRLFVLEAHTGVDIFGLMRRSALVGSVLHPSFHGADRALLAQLALRGPMLQLDEPLHQIREHGKRYTRQAQTARLRAAWHDAATRRTAQVPILKLYAAYHSIVRDAALTATERRACLMILSRWWLVNWNSARVMVDLAAVALPNIVGFAERLKAGLVGVAPGHFPQRDHRVDPAAATEGGQVPIARIGDANRFGER